MAGMEQNVLGVVIGATSMLGGYLFRKLLEGTSQKLSDMEHVPRFRNLGELKNHLAASSSQQDCVIVEGVVQKLGNGSLFSEKASVEGAAHVITTTTSTKVYDDERKKWGDNSNTVVNLNLALPFKLVDSNGNYVRVNSVNDASGFQSVLKLVFQEKTLPEKRSIGDFATGMALSEIPNGSHIQEFILLFGSPLAGVGTAVLSKQSMFNSDVIFTPKEVAPSINELFRRNEMMASTYKFLSLLLLIGGGTIIVFSVAPLVYRLFLKHSKARSNEVVA